jgi:hypothetical protein
LHTRFSQLSEGSKEMESWNGDKFSVPLTSSSGISFATF